ncbi:hypothetical protein P154DRAFT_521111 [Amniculicola lignicola CBS 123094]|uniref:RING-type domain-containing protein n=1 Tax=Amniculicola lignicola CBS 123094 TaxID=1392246 RepID=A0A6A5WN29_9PLEO|nr:hypothetical protein P154DRAFT_521111 [Amniculicola lignicola CBS 123094]
MAARHESASPQPCLKFDTCPPPTTPPTVFFPRGFTAGSPLAMGQANSRGTADPSHPRSRLRVRSTLWAPSLSSPPPERDDAVPELLQMSQSRAASQRFNPRNLLSTHPERPDAGSSTALDANNLTRRRSRITRARASLSTSIPHLFHRRTPSHQTDLDSLYGPSAASRLPPASRSTLRHPPSPSYESSAFLPRTPLPEPDMGFGEPPPSSGAESSDARTSTQRLNAARRDNRASSLIPSFRPDRGLRSMTSSLRRRRSPLPRDEDQAVILSRLLSVAAAATAASLVGDDPRAAAGVTGDGEDGAFDSFLQALQNGRIASALRQGGSENEDGADMAGAGTPGSLNFVRLFRFGSFAGGRRTDDHSRSASRNGPASDSGDGDDEGDGRLVPIIIVGIRSIQPGSNAGQDDHLPPFLDALSSLPAPVAPAGENMADGPLRQPQNGTRFSHRRRASMGGLNNFPANYDSQRHYRTAERPRPWSTLTDSPVGPLPPPSTPASSGLSAVSSGATTPVLPASPPSPTIQSSGPSRRGSFIRRATGSNLEPTAEEPHFHQRTPRERRLSESDFTRFGSGAARRNGVVEPDHNPGEGSRSWIIYVLGGNYPENHPILTTPSLFTDSPTYEDMVLLSTLIGPAKPPVASEEDVASAPGRYLIREEHGHLFAEAVDNGQTIALAADTRCLVCLCDFEISEEARRLVNCGHLFHRECIDQWLTTGRNSCPLCRAEGVEEKSKDDSGSAASNTSNINVEMDLGI